MESQFRSALVAWLRADSALTGMVNAIEEEGPVATSPPAIAIVASASADWSTKTAIGREVRLALELVDRSDASETTAEIVARIEQRIATLPADQGAFRVVVTQFLRSRAERRKRSMRAVLLEYRFKLITTENQP